MKKVLFFLLLLMVALPCLTGVANATTTTFAASNAAVKFSGAWTNTTQGGHTAYEGSSGNGDQIDLVATGTALSILANYSASVTEQASVDGGAFTTLTNNGGTWANVTVFTGLADTAHTVTIKESGGTPYLFYIDVTAGIIVTGAAPAIGSPSGWGTRYDLSDGTLSNYISVEQPFAAQNAFSYSSGDQGGAIRFRTNASDIYSWSTDSTASFAIYQDGTYLTESQINGSNDSTSNWSHIASGLDTTTQHLYALVASKTPSSFGCNLGSLRLVGGTGLNTVTTISAQHSLVAYGDSISVGSGVSNDVAQLWSQLLGQPHNLTVSSLGVGGSTVKHFGSGSPPWTSQAGETRVSDISTKSNAVIDGVVIEYGVNDMAQIGGTETSADMEASAETMLTAILALPKVTMTTKVIWIGILPDAYNTSNVTIATWNTAIQTAITNAGGGRVTYINPTAVTPAWNSGTMYFDTVHPNAAGNVWMRNAFDPILQPDTTPPTFTSGTVDSTGLVVTLTMSEAILPASSVTGFTVKDAAATRTVSSSSGSGSTFTLNLSAPIISAHTATIAYSSSGGNVTDLASNALVTFTAQALTNNSTYNIPGIPSTLTKALGTVNVTITWARVGGATSYKVYQVGNGTALGTYSDPTHQATVTVAWNSSASFYVTALDAYNESPVSSTISVSTKVGTGGTTSPGFPHPFGLLAPIAHDRFALAH